MPKLADTYINAEAQDGTKYQRKVSTNVCTDGEFTVEVPDDLYETAKKVLDTGIPEHLRQYWSGATCWPVSMAYSRTKWRACGRRLSDIKRFLDHAAACFVTVEEKAERVIVIRPILNVSFWTGGKRPVLPNGCGSSGGSWFTSDFTRRGGRLEPEDGKFVVGLAVAVYDKITSIRATGNTLRWVRVKNPDHHHQQETDPAYLLNSFGSGVEDPERLWEGESKEMPYTPEAAMFFVGMLEGLCKTAKVLNDFLADDEKLSLAIANQKQIQWNA